MDSLAFSKSIRTTLFTLTVLLPLVSTAQIETVTLNGEHIDTRLLETAQRNIRKESDYCVKEYPDWVREFVVMLLLTQTEARRHMTKQELQTEDYLWSSYRNQSRLSDGEPAIGFGYIINSVRDIYSQTLYENLKPVIAVSYTHLTLPTTPYV